MHIHMMLHLKFIYLVNTTLFYIDQMRSADILDFMLSCMPKFPSSSHVVTFTFLTILTLTSRVFLFLLKWVRSFFALVIERMGIDLEAGNGF